MRESGWRSLCLCFWLYRIEDTFVYSDSIYLSEHFMQKVLALVASSFSLFGFLPDHFCAGYLCQCACTAMTSIINFVDNARLCHLRCTDYYLPSLSRRGPCVYS